MSKGSMRRPTDEDVFQRRYEQLDWKNDRTNSPMDRLFECGCEKKNGKIVRCVAHR